MVSLIIAVRLFHIHCIGLKHVITTKKGAISLHGQLMQKPNGRSVGECIKAK
ncbi:MAG: hypothetical protein ACI9T9_001673 [Oleiphilaceae bacterium]|jgi:hypothetical protein